MKQTSLSSQASDLDKITLEQDQSALDAFLETEDDEEGAAGNGRSFNVSLNL